MTSGGGSSSAYYSVAQGELETNQYYSTYRYTAASQLYEAMEAEADFSDQVFTDFYSNNEGTSVGRFQK